MRHPEAPRLEASLLSHHHSFDREEFMLPVEVYEGWAILAGERGTFQYAIGERGEHEEGEAKVGEIVLCPPHLPLHRRMLTTMDFHYVQFHLSLYVGGSETVFPHSGKMMFRDTSRLLSTLTALREARNNVSVRYTEHLICDILYQAMAERAERRRAMRPRDAAIDEAVRLINEQAFETITMQQIAARVGLSQSQFTRKFQKETGVSPVKYWTGVRLNKVRQLLAETEQSLEAIAESCGYLNAFYLSRVFTKEMGVTPSRYRSTHRV